MKLTTILTEGIRKDPTTNEYIFDFDEDKVGDFLGLRYDGIRQYSNNIWYGFSYNEASKHSNQQDTSSLKHAKKAIKIINHLRQLDEIEVGRGYEYKVRPGHFASAVSEIVDELGITVDRRFESFDEMISDTINRIHTKIPESADFDDPTQAAEAIKVQTSENKAAAKDFSSTISNLGRALRRGDIDQADITRFVNLAADNAISNLGRYDLIIYPESRQPMAQLIADTIASKLDVPSIIGFNRTKPAFDKNAFIARGGDWPIDDRKIIWTAGGRLVKSWRDFKAGDPAIKSTGLQQWAKPFVRFLAPNDDILNHAAEEAKVLLVDDVIDSGSTLQHMINILDGFFGVVHGYAVVPAR